MADTGVLKVKVINPQEIVFEGEASFVMAPGKYGLLGIMPQHTALYAELVAGQIEIQGPNEQSLTIERGILKVRKDIVTILVGL